MVEFNLKNEFTKEESKIETEFSQEELDLIEEIRKLENDRVVKKGWSSCSGAMREYISRNSIPYGYGLKGPKNQILNEFRKSRDFLRINMEYIKKETQDCVEIMNQICDKITKLLEIDSLVRATNDSNTKNSEKGFHNVIQQLLSKIARLLNL